VGIFNGNTDRKEDERPRQSASDDMEEVVRPQQSQQQPQEQASRYRPYDRNNGGNRSVQSFGGPNNNRPDMRNNAGPRTYGALGDNKSAETSRPETGGRYENNRYDNGYRRYDNNRYDDNRQGGGRYDGQNTRYDRNNNDNRYDRNNNDNRYDNRDRFNNNNNRDNNDTRGEYYNRYYDNNNSNSNNNSQRFGGNNNRFDDSQRYVQADENAPAFQEQAASVHPAVPRYYVYEGRDESGAYVPQEGDEIREGILEIHQDGFGFMRINNCDFSDKDVYVSVPKIKKTGLRRGDLVKGYVRVAFADKPASLIEIISVNGILTENLEKRPNFDDLVPIYPDKRFKLERKESSKDYAIRCIDLIAPIGKGQRAMIVSPPKAGKTTLLKSVAASIAANYPEVVLMVLLIDERPEEVTDMQRSIKGDVVFSTFDEQPEHHVKAAEMVLARAKRMVELGKDVVILLDSLTRLARAYNMTIPPTGRTLSGGIDPGALHSPKRFFGSARNIENGGSLTIIASALVDTGSRMDDVIYEEFKGTGNMEIHLDRKLSEKRIFPAIDLAKSGTRKEELLLANNELEGIWAFRKILASGDSGEATENLLNMIIKTNTNAEFIDQLLLQMRAWQKEGFNFRSNK
jgi:transcription termination factor Rho